MSTAVPESALYNHLLDLDRAVSDTIARRKADFKEPFPPYNDPVKRVMRLTVQVRKQGAGAGVAEAGVVHSNSKVNHWQPRKQGAGAGAGEREIVCLAPNEWVRNRRRRAGKECHGSGFPAGLQSSPFDPLPVT